MKTPKDRARNSKRSPMSEIERRRAHLAAGGTIANYDTSHYAENPFIDINSIPHGDMPEGFGTMTPEAQDEQAQEESKKRNKIMPLSRNGEDIENSKRSRGENL
jgi:hypothetical protein